MPVFEKDDEAGCWRPSELARGPFAGLQGGAIAGLLIGEVERFAAADGLGFPAHATIWFLRPAPLARLRVRTDLVQPGNRVTVVDARLHATDSDRVLAVARVSVVRPRPVAIALGSSGYSTEVDPTTLPLREAKAPHGGGWFMDAMEVRHGANGVLWFRMVTPVLEGAGALATAAGPADWSHGIARPLTGVVADPNSNLNIHLLRPPRGEWLGIDAHTSWYPPDGTGIGSARLFDAEGEVGAVSMSVMLTPFA